MSAAVARRLIARGRVQGVFFRESVRRRALGLGVSGWAVNLPDGSVEVVLEGEADAVRALIEFCREGPRGAWVERLEETELEPRGLSGFEVR
ncbi:MAG: acylphosphatase [Thermoleophilaceae bacterium]|nr:acylphosphatase [Thermoleophilaceae bacterium]